MLIQALKGRYCWNFLQFKNKNCPSPTTIHFNRLQLPEASFLLVPRTKLFRLSPPAKSQLVHYFKINIPSTPDRTSSFPPSFPEKSFFLDGFGSPLMSPPEWERASEQAASFVFKTFPPFPRGRRRHTSNLPPGCANVTLITSNLN